MAAILHFTAAPRKGWSQAEQAEFARALAVLRRTGLPVTSEAGLSDEGDPWVIFLRADTGDVVAHIARIDGQVVAASAAMNDVVTGRDFRAVMDRIVHSQPLLLPSAAPGNQVFVHPAAVFVAFIATAVAWSAEEDVRPYHHQWSVDEYGRVALASPAGKEGLPHGGVLREAAMSKIEATRLGLNLHSQDIPESLVIAAALAAVAFVMPARTSRSRS